MDKTDTGARKETYERKLEICDRSLQDRPKNI